MIFFFIKISKGPSYCCQIGIFFVEDGLGEYTYSRPKPIILKFEFVYKLKKNIITLEINFPEIIFFVFMFKSILYIIRK